MGWRDALKSRKSSDGGAATAGGPQDITAIVSDEPEPDWFKPRTNGTYVGGAPDGRFRYLRFGLNGKVYLVSGAASAGEARPLLGPDNPDPTVGQYTAAGRFSVQRKFERPIVCTVLELDSAGVEVGFQARVTTSGPPSSEIYHYGFEADANP